MVDELSSRRHRFQTGQKIRLADGQSWVFPTPLAPGDSNGFRADPEYGPLLDVVRDADSDEERALGELALGIFLLSWNYDLSPSAFQDLLSFPPGSQSVEEWRASLKELVNTHSQSTFAFRDRSVLKQIDTATPGWVSRFLTRLWPSPTDQ